MRNYRVTDRLTGKRSYQWLERWEAAKLERDGYDVKDMTTWGMSLVSATPARR